MFIHLLEAFANVIFRTTVQQLTRYQLDSASRGPCAIAEVLVSITIKSEDAEALGSNHSCM